MLFNLVEIATANVQSSQADGIEADTKRIKMTETHGTTSSLLLETSDILKNVYSFLMFKEALEIRRTCRHARQNDIDIFQYSNMEAPKWTNTTNYPRNYDMARDYLLCNLKSTEKLGAALSNKTFPRSHSEQMLWKLVCHSKTDNGPAVALLLQHKACWSLDSYDDPCELLDIVLQKDFVDMAAVFQKHNVIQANMKMCFTCSAHVGAYKCSCQVECCHVPPRSDGNKWDFTITTILKALLFQSTVEHVCCWHRMHVAVAAMHTRAPSVFTPNSFARAASAKVLYVRLLGRDVAFNAWSASVSIVLLATSTKTMFRFASLRNVRLAA